MGGHVCALISKAHADVEYDGGVEMWNRRCCKRGDMISVKNDVQYDCGVIRAGTEGVVKGVVGYRDAKLDWHPEIQRHLRWNSQKVVVEFPDPIGRQHIPKEECEPVLVLKVGSQVCILKEIMASGNVKIEKGTVGVVVSNNDEKGTTVVDFYNYGEKEVQKMDLEIAIADEGDDILGGTTTTGWW